MKLGSLDGGDGGEHNNARIVEIFYIFATQNAFFFGTERCDAVQFDFRGTMLPKLIPPDSCQQYDLLSSENLWQTM